MPVNNDIYVINGTNDIYETAAHTGHLNMQKYLWDGVKRDRLSWAGDATGGRQAT